MTPAEAKPDDDLNERVHADAPLAPTVPKTPPDAGFIPFAVIEAESDLPTGSIWMCGMAGGPMRWLRVTLDVTQPADTWPAQVLQAIAARLFRTEDGQLELRFYGAVAGFVINHAVDHAVRYDRDGNAVEVLSALRPVPTLSRTQPR